MQERSVAEITEHELIERIHADPWHFNLHGLPPQTPGPVRFRLRVTSQELGVPGAFGDADSIVVPGRSFDLARAVEFKRVKVPVAAFHTRQPNKLHELTKAVEQANLLARAGFAAVWLTVFVLIDGREQTGGQFMLVPGIFEFLDWTKAAIPLHQLHPDVGIVVSEFVQPVDRSPFETGMAGGQMLRSAELRPQPPELTAAIAALGGWRGTVQ